MHSHWWATRTPSPTPSAGWPCAFPSRHDVGRVRMWNVNGVERVSAGNRRAYEHVARDLGGAVRARKRLANTRGRRHGRADTRRSTG
jgi:hypothetical protein